MVSSVEGTTVLGEALNNDNKIVLKFFVKSEFSIPWTTANAGTEYSLVLTNSNSNFLYSDA